MSSPAAGTASVKRGILAPATNCQRSPPRARSGVTAILVLAPDHVLYANGETLSLYEATNAAPVLTIELDSEIQALATHGISTVVAATRLGLVALDIPWWSSPGLMHT